LREALIEKNKQTRKRKLPGLLFRCRLINQLTRQVSPLDNGFFKSDKRADRTLTLELRAGQLPRAQSRPKKTLRFRFLAPQPSCAFAWCGWLIHESQL
jgi:hypothetical protein